MSRRRRRRTSPQAPRQIRHASNDDDVITIHRFLLAVAGPHLLAPVDVRVTKEEVAIMAMRGDKLAGTMGLIKPIWWYSDEAFLDRSMEFLHRVRGAC